MSGIYVLKAYNTRNVITFRNGKPSLYCWRGISVQINEAQSNFSKPYSHFSLWSNATKISRSIFLYIQKFAILGWKEGNYCSSIVNHASRPNPSALSFERNVNRIYAGFSQIRTKCVPNRFYGILSERNFQEFYRLKRTTGSPERM